jgi:hypothetical protein
MAFCIIASTWKLQALQFVPAMRYSQHAVAPCQPHPQFHSAMSASMASQFKDRHMFGDHHKQRLDLAGHSAKMLTGSAFTVGNSFLENFLKRFQLTVAEVKKLRGRVVEFLQ